MVEVGAAAPDFDARTTDGQTVRLSELRGRTVLLAFLPCEWCAVCGIRLRAYEREAERLRAAGLTAIVVTISDGPDATRFAAALGLEHRVVLDGTRAITRRFASAFRKSAWGADETRPSAVLIGPDGRVLFAARCQDDEAFVEPEALLAALAATS